jgi:hypothetical protein
MTDDQTEAQRGCVAQFKVTKLVSKELQEDKDLGFLTPDPGLFLFTSLCRD